MTTAYTTLLGLAQPVTGELSGTWGSTVNDYITTYLDSAVAGAQTISGTQTAVTLSVTNGSSLVSAGAAATGSAQYSIINCTGTPASLLTITAPAASKTYIVINATAQSVKLVGAGPTTGVTMVTGEKALCSWNGTDFVKVATSVADGVTSVAMTVPSILSVSGSPITSAGTLALTYSGTALPVANGGTGLTAGTSGGVLAYTASGTLASSAALTQYGVVYGGGAGAVPVATANGTTGQAFIATTSGAPSWGVVGAVGGGTGVANNAAMTVTGSGNFAYTRTLTGTTNVTFPTTGTLATLAGTETLTNKTLTSPTITNQLATTIRETITVSATASTGTINYDASTQAVLYYTTNASGNFTLNFRGTSGISLNTLMNTGESLSLTFLSTQGTTAYYNSAVQVDGSSVTPKWQGGTAPTSGNASSIDSYTYVIIKTGSAAFTVLASVTKFA
jgi:hypothetical protein